MHLPFLINYIKLSILSCFSLNNRCVLLPPTVPIYWAPFSSHTVPLRVAGFTCCVLVALGNPSPTGQAAMFASAFCVTWRKAGNSPSYLTLGSRYVSCEILCGKQLLASFWHLVKPRGKAGWTRCGRRIIGLSNLCTSICISVRHTHLFKGNLCLLSKLQYFILPKVSIARMYFLVWCLKRW